jgi:hypothetical protein
VSEKDLNLPEPFVIACEVGMAAGLAPLPEHVNERGVVEVEVPSLVGGNTWKLVFNPGKEKRAGIEPYQVLLEWNGWLAGLVDAGGGAMAAGLVANEEQFLVDCRAYCVKHGQRKETE